jgi:hypothetical protein
MSGSAPDLVELEGEEAIEGATAHRSFSSR